MRKDEEIKEQTGGFGGNPDGERVDFDAKRDKAKPETTADNSDSSTSEPVSADK